MADRPGGVVEVSDRPREHRLEERVDGEPGGSLVYRRPRPGLSAFMHTEVDDRFEGRGVGSALAAEALGAARREGLAVLPFCPFVAAYLRRHPEWADLVPEPRRAEFGL